MRISVIILCLLLSACSRMVAVSIAWDPVDPIYLVTSYNVYRIKGNQSTLVGSTAGTALNVDNALQGNRSTFYIKAVNSVGESVESARITVQR